MSIFRNILLALSLIIIAQSINDESKVDEEIKEKKTPIHLRSYYKYLPKYDTKRKK